MSEDSLSLQVAEFLQSSNKVEKLSSNLFAIGEAYQKLTSERGVSAQDTAAAITSAASFMAFQDSMVVVDMIAVDGDTGALLADLEALGLEKGAAFSNVVSGLLPLSSVAALSSVSTLKFASASLMAVNSEQGRPSHRGDGAVTNVGSTQNQGDAAMQADDIRALLGIDGVGITVGVISDSFDTSGGTINYAADIASGDLPDDVNLVDDTFIGGIDEGRAMAQLIHDIAPGAGLSFHTAFNGIADFAQGILDLADVSDIVVDDIIYFAEPMFQDGIVAQAVDQAFAQGVPYFSSAGNSARQSYESKFRPVEQNGFTLHDFDPGEGVDTRQSFVLESFEATRLAFQWDDPFLTGSPDSGGATGDMDIYLYDAATGDILAASNAFNIGVDPFEFLVYQNTTGEAMTVELEVHYFDGGVPNVIKYVDYNGGSNDAEYHTFSGSSYGHASAEGGLGVAAAPYFFTPDFGVDPPLLEGFSSIGDTPILFDAAGNRLDAAEIRQRVDITAPDGVNTTFFGDDVDGDGFPNFFGTSAAAPNAAALAALLLEDQPDLTPTELYDALRMGTIDVLNDRNGVFLGEGYDNASGFGLINAPLIFDVPAKDFGLEVDPDNLAPVADALLSDGGGGGIAIQNLTYTGAINAICILPDGLTISQDGVPEVMIGESVFLSSGGPPPRSNTSSSYTINNGQPGDPDLDASAEAAFSGAGSTNDAAVLEFTFEIAPGTNVDGIRFDVMFGSDEFPEFSDTSFVDIAAVYVNGENVALFNNDPTTPLSVIDDNLAAGNFIDNTGGTFDIEYDGFSPVLTVNAPVVVGTNTVKIGVADTGDFAYDSGLIIGNLVGTSGGGSGVTVPIGGTDGDETLDGDDSPEEFFCGLGNDTVNPGGGNDIIHLEGGANTVMGSAADLNGDTVTEFGSNDKIVVQNAEFDADDVTVTSGSAILDIDTDGDGNAETRIVLTGDYEGVDFTFEVEDGNTVIKSTATQAIALTVENDRFITTDDNNDRVFGAGGNDAIVSAGGDDILSGGAGGDTMIAGLGNDILKGGAGSNTLTGGGDDDVFVFNSSDGEGVDFITDFQDGSDMIRIAGFAGIDGRDDLDISNLEGFGAVITLTFEDDSKRQIVVENTDEADLSDADFDFQTVETAYAFEAFGGTIALSESNDRFITTDAGSNTVHAGDGNDVLVGAAGADILAGEDGGDLLIGGEGNDRITGGSGSDTLRGGANADTFVFISGAIDGVDFVEDFELAEDRIELQGFGFASVDSLDITPNAAGAVLDLDGQGLVVFTGLSVEQLETANFDFL